MKLKELVNILVSKTSFDLNQIQGLVNNKDNPCDFFFSDSFVPPISYTLPSIP